ncbi:Serine/threonine protein kinase [Thermococcus sp. 4557]|uniref:serine/threonine protein kinase n=1 Tax=Thermococcus sp. (strain CGMCC 1.5172 / 4557) TaxID=1042877 RepID=UPI000219E30A|nr:serine/threonine-protein kinase [Thermococcus sp. 4557]AEK71922.1 Serine/threonine protein kinase [Thermococcus sp. 4557]
MGRIADLREIESYLPKISNYMTLGLPGSNIEQAKDYLQNALNALNADDTGTALEMVKKALIAALPDRDFLLSNALRLRHDGEKLLKARNFEEAISKFAESLEKYHQALTVLEVEDGTQEELIQKLRNTIETTENLRKIANFRRIYQKIKDAQTEQELWDAIRELETVEVPMEDDRFDALIVAHRKIIMLQLQAVADMMIEAAEMYRKEDWFSAKKSLESAKKVLENLLEMAKKHDLVEEVAMINELIKACDSNLYGITELLYTGEVPKGWRLQIPDKDSFVLQEEVVEEETFDLSVNFETRLEQIKERYRIIRTIGEGAFSYVYEAKNPQGHKVALKVLKYLDKESTSSFMREFAAAQKLDHENIVKVHRADPRLGFLEMELASNNLEKVKKPISPSVAGRIIFEIGRALHHAHSQKIYHRDIKPSNILIFGSLEQVKLGDWGLARLASRATRKSSLVRHKTILYSSPEQIKDPEHIDHRSDIFQLGIVFYEILTGKHPFTAEYEGTIINNILNKTPEPPSYLNPEARVFDEIVMKMLEKDPEKRYQTVRELQNDIKEVLIRMGVHVRDSVSSRERAKILAENAYLRIKAIVDGFAQEVSSELAKLAADLDALYHETGYPELKDLHTQISLMASENARPTEDTFRRVETVLKKWM